MKVRFKIFFPMILFILFVASLAYPQIRESGEIQGTVTDLEDMPLPGVTVTVESPNLIGGVQSMVTGSEGFYKFRSLSIGTYKVTARLSGFNILLKEGIGLHSGMTLTVDFKMTQATVEEEVVVIGEVPTIDIKSSQPNAVVITDNLLTALPGKPIFEGIMNMTPGTGFYDSYGGGYDYPSTYQFDGVYLNSPSTGSIRQFFNIDINTIKEVKVQALGLPAEYGHVTGAVMTAVSKSGSNKFSTLNEFSFVGDGWNSQNNQKVPLEDWRSPVYADYEYKTTKYFDVGLQAGGKLIQDKLWFFISGEYDQSKEYPVGTTKVKKNYNPRFFTKLTLQLNPSNKLNFAVNRFEQNKENALASSIVPPDVDMDSTITGWLYNLSWTSIFSSTTFLDSKFGFNWKKSSNMPLAGKDVPGGYDLILRTYVDNYSGYGETTYWTYHASSHLSHYIPELLSGSHDFKMGTELIHMKEFSATGYPGGIYYYYWNGANYQKTERAITERDKYSTALTGFIQDRWSVTKRLTLNLGLRYDHYWHRIPSPDRGVVYNNSSLSPRVGFSYDLLGDRKNVVKFHYAHYNEKLKSSSFSLFENRYDESVVSRWIGGAWVHQYTSVYTPQDIEQDTNVTHPFIREITISFERELFRDATLSITFYNRTLGKNFYQFNFAAEYASVTLTNPGPDNVVGTADDMGTFTGYYQSNPGQYFYLLANMEKGQPEWSQEDPQWYARGLQIVFNKRFSNRWQMIASYNYTRSKGNEQGTRVTMTKPNYYNVYGEQGAYYPQPHQFKIQANVILPVVETSIGLFARWESGPPLTPRFVVRLPYGYGYFNSEPPGQTKGRAVSNIDLKIEKIFNIKGVRLTAMLDIFNLTNNYDRDTGMYTSYGPYYNTRTTLKDPRTFRAGFRIIF